MKHRLDQQLGRIPKNQNKEKSDCQVKSNQQSVNTPSEDFSFSQTNNSNAQLMTFIQDSLEKLALTFQSEIRSLKEEINVLKEQNKKLYLVLTNSRNIDQSLYLPDPKVFPTVNESNDHVNKSDLGKTYSQSQFLSNENVKEKDNSSLDPNNIWVEVVSRNTRKVQYDNEKRKQTLNSVSSNTAKEKRKLIYGKSQTKDNLVRDKKKALFVTRFGPNVTIQDVEDIVKDLDIPIKCTKLKTKYNTYSSFHVEVNESEFQELSNPDIWPKGIMIGPFYGRLKEEKDLNDINVNENSNQT